MAISKTSRAFTLSRIGASNLLPKETVKMSKEIESKQKRSKK